uniref:Fibronectin type-III domain-containing protein n=1 Tax=Cacopsylla melanoneura TaxID=428564 RepID=A0A8D8SXG3_9HEMI
MVILAVIFVLQSFGFVGPSPHPSAPQNVTITFLSPSSVRIAWMTAPGLPKVDHYDVNYKPSDAKVVAVIAGNTESVTLSNLIPDTQYQVTVAAVVTINNSTKKYRTNLVVFRTLYAETTTDYGWGSNRRDSGGGGNNIQAQLPSIRGDRSKQPVIPPFPGTMAPGYVQVRGVEVTIVLIVLCVWVGAIILFFNRWGKIRMLIPYQPDYKDTQLKVPGTGACGGANGCQNPGGTSFCCSQRYLHRCGLTDSIDWHSKSAFMMSSRRKQRINSAIYISPSFEENQGVEGDYYRYGGNIRKTCSADNLPRMFYEAAHRSEEDVHSGGMYGNHRIPPHRLPTVSVSVATSNSDEINTDAHEVLIETSALLCKESS